MFYDYILYNEVLLNKKKISLICRMIFLHLQLVNHALSISECSLFFREFYHRDFNISRINDNFKDDGEK